MSDDYVMVPREPTPDMARAGRKAVAAVADKMEAAKQLAVHVIDFWQQVGHTPANEIYRAMIAAAPPAAPAVPLTDEQFADMVAEASLAVDLAANPLKLLAFARAVLSAAPVVREPLTDAQIDKIFDDAHENMPKGELFRTFVTRAIERAHGIGGGGK